MSEEKTTQNQTIEDFNFNGDVDLFALVDKGIDKIPEKKEKMPPKEDEEEEVKDDNVEEGREVSKEEEKEVDLFAEIDKEREETEEEGEEEPDKDVQLSNVNLLTSLKDKGLVEYDLEEDTELDDDLASDILEDAFEAKINTKVTELISELPDELKQLNKIALDGGNWKDLLQNSTSDTQDIDITTEEGQIAQVKQDLKRQGYDDEYIKFNIETLKDSKRLETIAKKLYDKAELKKKEVNQSKLEEAARNKELQIENRRKMRDSIKATLKENKELGALTVSSKDISTLPEYMTSRNISLEDGNKITSMQKDLMKVLNSPKGSIQIAKLLKAANEKGELDFSNIISKTETKVTNKIKKEVTRSKKKKVVAGKKNLYLADML